MWNALAGYGGLVSIGQQAFISVSRLRHRVLRRVGFHPYLAMVIAMLVAGVISIPISFSLPASEGRTVRDSVCG